MFEHSGLFPLLSPYSLLTSQLMPAQIASERVWQSGTLEVKEERYRAQL